MFALETEGAELGSQLVDHIGSRAKTKLRAEQLRKAKIAAIGQLENCHFATLILRITSLASIERLASAPKSVISTVSWPRSGDPFAQRRQGGVDRGLGFLTELGDHGRDNVDLKVVERWRRRYGVVSNDAVLAVL